jgi:hypothetical protein
MIGADDGPGKREDGHGGFKLSSSLRHCPLSGAIIL